MRFPDLVFEDGLPWAVFEWTETHDGPVPRRRTPLDFRWLHRLSGSGPTHVYELPIDEP